MNKNHILENLKYLRARLSLTQGEFGALFGVSRDNIASYERGTEPKIEFIARLVDHFRISYDDFISAPLDDDFFANRDTYEGQEGITRAEEPHSFYQAGESASTSALGWQNIPIYDWESTSGLRALFSGESAALPVDYFRASTLPRCEGGIRVSGDSMAPVVNPGDIVLYKPVSDIENGILWGEMYLLSFEMDGDEYVVVKYIRQSPLPGYVSLVSQNPNHAPKEIPLQSIRALALVKMSLRINALK